MAHKRVHRLSGPAVAIGYILLIPSLCGMAFAVLLWVLSTAGLVSNENLATNSEELAATGWLVGCGSVVFGSLFVASLVGGLVGWLLVMRKSVLKCENCGAEVTTSS
jgi:hypothetical protein